MSPANIAALARSPESRAKARATLLRNTKAKYAHLELHLRKMHADGKPPPSRGACRSICVELGYLTGVTGKEFSQMLLSIWNVGVRTSEGWSKEELSTLRQHYGTLGSARMFGQGLLPGRTEPAIRRRAQTLGLAHSRGKAAEAEAEAEAEAGDHEVTLREMLRAQIETNLLLRKLGEKLDALAAFWK